MYKHVNLPAQPPAPALPDEEPVDAVPVEVEPVEPVAWRLLAKSPREDSSRRTASGTTSQASETRQA